MPCMCGDTHCWSCGPAQGVHKCPVCGRWNDEEYDDDGVEGCINPEECTKAADEMYRELDRQEESWQYP